MKTCRAKYDKMTATFQGLYETLGYIMVRGDPQEHFLGYGYSKQNSKILHSHYKKRIPSSFSSTFFNRHRIQFESGAFHGSNISNIYYFLPSTTDRVEETNKNMGSVNLSPIIFLKKHLRLKTMFNLTTPSLITSTWKKKKLPRLWLKCFKKS